MARYQARNGEGVLDTTTGRVVLPWMPEFQAYLEWIAEGNTPDDPPPAPAPAPDRSYYIDAGEQTQQIRGSCVGSLTL